DERDGGDRGQNVHETGEEIDTQSPLLSRPGRLPQHLSVIEDDVDTDELLEGRQAHADQDHRGKPTRAPYEQVRQARLVLTAQALLDLPHQCFRVAADSSENPAGVVPPTVGNQEARRL